MENEKILKEIREAEEEIRELCETEENKRRNALWDSAGVSSDYFHAIPADKDRKPLVIEFEREAYAAALGYDIIEFYHNPYLHYLSGLRTQIFKFKNFDDDTPIAKGQAVYESAAFEKCIFGGEQAIYTEHDAVVSKEPLIKEREDLDRMEYPDFYEGGCMPRTIRFYEQVREIASDDFAIPFPQWGRSPWGCAWQVRGLDNLMIDCIEDPDWLVRLLDFLGESRKRWTLQRNEYLGLPLAPGNIYNDEVTFPIVSPDLYEKYILPGEIDLANFFGGLAYWHSCGDTTELFSLINRIPNLKMLTVSAWSDVEKAGKVYDKEKALEVQLHNYRDVIQPETERTLPDRIELIKESTKDHKSIVHACGIVPVHGFEHGMERLRVLSETARRILG